MAQNLTPLQRLVSALPRRSLIDPFGLLPEDMAQRLFPVEPEVEEIGPILDPAIAPIGHARAPARTVTRTFGFLDIAEFTATVEKLNPDELHALVSLFRALVREVSAARGVRISRWIGDGVLLIGLEPGPLAATVVEIAQRLTEADIPVYGGLACGEVIVFEGDDYLGSTVNLASRLSDAARRSQVLADASVIEYLPDWIEHLSPVTAKMKGLGKRQAYPLRVREEKK